MSKPNELGFVLPPQQPQIQQQQPQPQPAGYPQYPQYPPQQQQQYAPYPPPNYQHQPFPAPIQQQPVVPQIAGGNTVQWWSYTDNIFQNYLMNASSFHVKQKIELLEILAGWESENKYSVKDQNGNKVFYVGEVSNMCGRQCFGSSRPFTLDVKDNRGLDVLKFERELSCTCFCGLFCPDKLTVYTPQGQLLGTVNEEFDIIYPRFSINDAFGNTKLKIVGPACPISCGGASIFRVEALNGASVGTISKEWGGLVRELFTDADYFSISFPHDLDQSLKAVCLGALFLIVSFTEFILLSILNISIINLTTITNST